MISAIISIIAICYLYQDNIKRFVKFRGYKRTVSIPRNNTVIPWYTANIDYTFNGVRLSKNAKIPHSYYDWEDINYEYTVFNPKLFNLIIIMYGEEVV